jgi:regulatory protein
MDDADWVTRAIGARSRRFGLAREKLGWEEKARQGRFLAQRGFTGDQVERALAAREGDDAAPPVDNF